MLRGSKTGVRLLGGCVMEVQTGMDCNWRDWRDRLNGVDSEGGTHMVWRIECNGWSIAAWLYYITIVEISLYVVVI